MLGLVVLRLCAVNLVADRDDLVLCFDKLFKFLKENNEIGAKKPAKKATKKAAKKAEKESAEAEKTENAEETPENNIENNRDLIIDFRNWPNWPTRFRSRNI